MFEIFKTEPPDIIVNFAAESHVDRSIENPGVFLNTNIVACSAEFKLDMTFIAVFCALHLLIYIFKYISSVTFCISGGDTAMSRRMQSSSHDI